MVVSINHGASHSPHIFESLRLRESPKWDPYVAGTLGRLFRENSRAQRVQAQYNEKESQKLYEDMLSDARCPVRMRLPGPTWHKLCTHELLYWGYIGVILGLYRNYIGVI